MASMNISHSTNVSVDSEGSITSNELSTTHIIYGVYTTLVSVLTITGNLLTIVAFFNEQSLREKASNLLIWALSFADMMYGIYMCVFSTPLAILQAFPYGEIGCMVAVALSNLYIVGNLLLIAISMDRVLLVAFDYSRYMKIQTKTRIKQTIASCFSICLIIAVIEISMWNYAKRVNVIAANLNFDYYCLSPPRRIRIFGLLYSLGFICCPVFVVGALSTVFFCFLYIRIKKSRKIGNNASASTSTASSTQATTGAHALTRATGSEQSSAKAGENKNEGSSKNRYIKPAVTLAALVAAMGISMLPYCIYVIVELFCPKCADPMIVYILLTIVQCNPLLDPIFYAVTQKKIRQFYKNKSKRIYEWFRQ